MPQRGNPQLPIRLSPERRKLWEEAARIDRRTITDFIRHTIDERARVVIARSKFTLYIMSEDDNEETHNFDTRKEAMAYLKNRFPKYADKEFWISDDAAPFDIWIYGPANADGIRPVVWGP